MRYAGIKAGKIVSISDRYFIDDSVLVIEVPNQFAHISNEQLITSYTYMSDKIVSASDRKCAKDMRIAFITNYKQQCGIAEYGSLLFPEVAKRVQDFKLFAEYTVKPTGAITEFGGVECPDKIIQCWKRGESLSALATEVRTYNPDAVILNMEWGIFPKSKWLLSFVGQLHDYRVIPIFHSVYPFHQDKIISESAFKEIIVHMDGAKQALIDKSVVAKVSVVPHGCNQIDKSKVWNSYGSNNNVIISGYGLRYKNFDDAIRAIGIVKQNIPDVFLTVLFTETTTNMVEHNNYFEALIKVVKELNLEDNVALLRGYKSDAVMHSFYKQNRVAIFPYQQHHAEHKVFGASGSARLAMSKNICVISSSIPHFSDLPTIKADTVQDLAKEIQIVLSDPEKEKVQLAKQERYLEENSWAKCAEKIIKVLEG